MVNQLALDAAAPAPTNGRDTPMLATDRIVLPVEYTHWKLADELAKTLPISHIREVDDRLEAPLNSPFTLPTLASRLLPNPEISTRLDDPTRHALTAALTHAARNRNDASALHPRHTDWLDQLPDTMRSRLRGYQLAAIDYTLRIANRRGFLAGDPGAAKTAVALAITTIADAWPAVVLCKPSLTGNWEDEIATWLGDDTPVAVLSGQKSNPDQIPAGTRIVICSYALAHHRLDDLAAIGPRALICDESQYVKTPPHSDAWLAWHRRKQDDDPKPGREPKAGKGSWRTWAAKQLSTVDTMDTVLLLTATPAPNGNHIEYLPQIDILGRLDEFGGPDRFVERYCRWCSQCWTAAGRPKQMPPMERCDHITQPERKMGNRRVPNDRDAINTRELGVRLRSTMLTRHTQRQMYPQLPPIVPIELRLPLSTAGRREYRQVEDEFIDYLKTHAAKKAAAEGISIGQAVAQALRNAQGDNEQLVKLAHLQQAAARAKMPAVLEWLADHAGKTDTGHPNKTIVFAWHRDVQQQLIDTINQLLGKSPHAESLERHYPDGYPGVPTILSAQDTNAEQIRESKRRFQDNPDEPFIVCSIAAAAEGHTLDAAYTVAMVQLPPTYAMVRQCVGRAYGRSSNPHGATLVTLIGEGTIDHDVAAAIDTKKLAQVLTLDEGSDDSWGKHGIVEFESEAAAESAFIDALYARTAGH